MNVAYYTAETLAKSLAHKEQNLVAWRNEVDRRLARKIEGEARAKTAPPVARLYPQRPGLPH